MRQLAVAALLVLAIGQPAHAQPSAPEGEGTSYRSSTLLADGLALGLIGGGLFAKNGDVQGALLLGGVVTMLGTPLVHVARGHHARAVASVGVRTAALGLGLAVAIAHEDLGRREPDTIGVRWFWGGMVGGLVVASAIDATLLTHETKPRRWTPVIAPLDGGARVGIATPF